MLEERFRFIYLSKDKTDIKQISLTWKKFCVCVGFAACLFSGIIVLGIFSINRLYHNYRIVSLRNDNEFLEKQIISMKEKVSYLGVQLAEVENRSDILLAAAGLQAIDEDIRKLGVGGPFYAGSPEIGYYSDAIHKTALEANADLDRFLLTLQFQRSTINNISARINARNSEMSQFPSIRPVLFGPINSPFGWRNHPLTQKRTMHLGVDLLVNTGTAVMSTAEGRVQSIRNSPSLGLYVEVDHGNGFLTRYGHLSKTLVKQGQKVKRWDKIALSGATGLVEGPHLHYEVWKDNKRINPADYILN